MNRIEQLYNEWQSLLPLKPEDQSRLDRKFMLEFNYNSNHIEGNTLTYGQTELLLLFGKVVDEANMKDLEEMKAHNVCLKMIRTEAADKGKPLTETFIRQLHLTMLREDYVCYRQLPDGTNTSYTIHVGIYKTRSNWTYTVTGERFDYASPEETPALMADLVNWYNEAETKGELSPIELASVFHYRYIRIHPFEDGNGRIARLMVNYILARHNYPMIVVKSKDKNSFLTALNRCDVNVGIVPSDGAHADLEQLSAFVDYMSGCLEIALKVCIKAAKGESIEEDDDVDKELFLLAQTARSKRGNIVRRTDDYVMQVILQFVFPLQQQLSAALDSYAAFYSRRSVVLKDIISLGVSEIFTTAYFEHNRHRIAQINNIQFCIRFEKPTELLKAESYEEQFLYVTFEAESYKLSLDEKQEIYRYGELPTMEQRKEWVKLVKHRLLDSISGKVNQL